MEIENMPLKQLQEMIKLFGNSSESSTKRDNQSFAVGQYVIVRTYSARAYFGILVSRDGTEAKLKNAKRFWIWYGANTLHEVALHGVLPKSKISEEISEILLTNAIEIIPCTEKAIQCLMSAAWEK